MKSTSFTSAQLDEMVRQRDEELRLQSAVLEAAKRWAETRVAHNQHPIIETYSERCEAEGDLAIAVAALLEAERKTEQFVATIKRQIASGIVGAYGGDRMNDKTHCYVGIAPCGCIHAVTTDRGDKDTARDVAEYIRAGLTIERVPSDSGWRERFGRKCDQCKRQEQKELI